jgi:hypothetical protein
VTAEVAFGDTVAASAAGAGLGGHSRSSWSAGRFATRLAAVCGLAGALRIVYTTIVDPQAGRISDASAYHLLGRHLADGLGYVRPFDLTEFGRAHPTAEYPPLFPALLGFASRLGLDGVEAQQVVVGTLVGTATVAVVALVARHVAGPQTGIVAGVTAALYPMLFQADAVLMAEGLFALGVAATVLATYRVVERPAPGRAAAVGALLGACALTRGEGLVLAAVTVAGIAVARRTGGARGAGGAGDRRARLRAALVAALVAAAVIAPWTARNAMRLDAFVPVSTNLGTLVDGANCPLTYRGSQIGLWRSTFGTGPGELCFEGFAQRGAPYGGVAQERFDEAAAARAHLEDGLRYARDNADRLPTVVAARVLRTFALWPDLRAQIRIESLEGRDRAWQWAGTVAFWVLAPLALAGAVLLGRRRVSRWPLVAPVVAVTVTAAVTYGNQRFRIAAEPAVVVLAAVALADLARRRPLRRRRAAS